MSRLSLKPYVPYPVICGDCRSASVVRHCAGSSVCSWARCLDCKHYTASDGRTSCSTVCGKHFKDSASA